MILNIFANSVEQNLLSFFFNEEDLNKLDIFLINKLQTIDNNYQPLVTKDKLISIFSFTCNPQITNKLNNEIKKELYDEIYKILNFIDIDNILNLSDQLIINIIEKTIEIDYISIYRNIYVIIFNFMIDHFFYKGYNLFFEHFINKKIYIKLLKFLNYSQVHHISITGDTDDSIILKNIIFISSFFFFSYKNFSVEQYYELLFKYRKEIVDENNKKILPLGNFLLKIAEILIDLKFQNLPTEGINEIIEKYILLYQTKIDKSIMEYIAFLKYLEKILNQ